MFLVGSNPAQSIFNLTTESDMTEAIVVNPKCEDSMRKAAEKLQVSVQALRDACKAFSKSVSNIGEDVINALKQIAPEVLKKKGEDCCDEQLVLPKARFESYQGRGSQLQLPRRKPLQLESTYG